MVCTETLLAEHIESWQRWLKATDWWRWSQLRTGTERFQSGRSCQPLEESIMKIAVGDEVEMKALELSGMAEGLTEIVCFGFPFLSTRRHHCDPFPSSSMCLEEERLQLCKYRNRMWLHKPRIIRRLLV